MRKRGIPILLALLLGLLCACGNNQNQEDNDMQNPQIIIELEDGGKIVVELYPDKAPNTVNNFLALAKSGYYTNKLFHRVVPDFMIQGGGLEEYGRQETPGYSIKGEFASNGFAQNDLKHERGVISMARSNSYDSASGQFFIMLAADDYLDEKYAAFGKVISGMDVADRLALVETRVAPDDNRPRPEKSQPIKEIRIKSVTAETFGQDYPAPVTIK